MNKRTYVDHNLKKHSFWSLCRNTWLLKKLVSLDFRESFFSQFLLTKNVGCNWNAILWNNTIWNWIIPHVSIKCLPVTMKTFRNNSIYSIFEMEQKNKSFVNIVPFIQDHNLSWISGMSFQKYFQFLFHLIYHSIFSYSKNNHSLIYNIPSLNNQLHL